MINLINFFKGNTLSYQFIARITPPKVIPGLIKSIFTKQKKLEINQEKLKNSGILSMKFIHIKDLKYL